MFGDSSNKKSTVSIIALSYFVWHALAASQLVKPATRSAFALLVSAGGRHLRETTRRRCRCQAFSTKTNRYVCAGDRVQQSVLASRGYLNLTTTSAMDCGSQTHVDPDVVCSTSPPSTSNEAAFIAAVEGLPSCAHLLSHTKKKSTSLLQHFEPLERIVLTANGNLQRVISAYHDSPVTLDIKRSTEVGPRVFHREVTLSVLGQTCCVAKSVVVLHSSACVDVASRGKVGIGQLFRFLDVLPSFELLNAGRTPNVSAVNLEEGEGQALAPGPGRSSRGGMWRVYDLRSRHLSCRIHEDFPPELFSYSKPMATGSNTVN